MTSSPAPVTPDVFRILVIEDEPKLREAVAEGLRLEGWHVTTAENGGQALELIAAHTFDLLLLDWMLPDLDGMEILMRVRLHAPQVRVVMMTARSAHWNQIVAAQNGATDYLIKPFAFADLVERCRALQSGAGPADGSAVRSGTAGKT